MPKRKWYVVIVGREIGVFDNWAQVGIIVKGVPNAVHQSFSSKEEAEHIFAQEAAKGKTKIVIPEGSLASSPIQPSINSKAGGNYRIRTSLSSPASQTSSRSFEYTSGRTSPIWSSRHYGGPTCCSSQPSSPPIPLSSPAASQKSPDKLAASLRRLEIIRAIFEDEESNNDTKIEGHSSRRSDTQTSTPKSTNNHLDSPRTFSSTPSQTSQVVVKTPTWLMSYQQNRQLESESLSPLNSADIPLNNFGFDRVNRSTIKDIEGASIRGEKFGSSTSSSHSSPLISESRFTANRSSGSTPRRHLGAFASRPSPKTVVGHDVDPRSPILNNKQVPDLAFISSLSFSRPSPNKLPLESSALFQG